jgi:hypothetical protein
MKWLVGGLFIVQFAVLGWVFVEESSYAAELEWRIGEMCGLKVVVPLEGPTELESFVNTQTFPAWCGPDPHAHPVTEVRPRT